MKVTFFTNIVPTYRYPFFEQLSLSHDLTIICSKQYPGISLRNSPNSANLKILFVKLFHFNKIFIHSLPLYLLFKNLSSTQVYIFVGNLRHLSYVFFSFFL